MIQIGDIVICKKVYKHYEVGEKYEISNYFMKKNIFQVAPLKGGVALWFLEEKNFTTFKYNLLYDYFDTEKDLRLKKLKTIL